MYVSDLKWTGTDVYIYYKLMKIELACTYSKTTTRMLPVCRDTAFGRNNRVLYCLIIYVVQNIECVILPETFFNIILSKNDMLVSCFLSSSKLETCE